MNRKLCILIAIILISSVVPAFASNSGDPAPDTNTVTVEHVPEFAVILSEMKDISVEPGGTAKLFCDAVSPDGGTLTYQWYLTQSGKETHARKLEGKTDAHCEFVINSAAPLYFYCEVWNVFPKSAAGPVRTRMIKVTVDEYQKEYIERLEIIQLPDKLVYRIGEKLDLKGLIIRVHSNLGSRDTEDVSAFNVSGFNSSTSGRRSISIYHDNIGTGFWVDVVEGNNKTDNKSPDPEVSGNTAENNTAGETQQTDNTSSDSQNADNTATDTQHTDKTNDSQKSNKSNNAETANTGKTNSANNTVTENSGKNTAHVIANTVNTSDPKENNAVDNTNITTADNTANAAVPNSSGNSMPETNTVSVNTAEDIKAPEDKPGRSGDTTSRVIIIAAALLIATVCIIAGRIAGNSRGKHSRKRR